MWGAGDQQGEGGISLHALLVRFPGASTLASVGKGALGQIGLIQQGSGAASCSAEADNAACARH